MRLFLFLYVLHDSAKQSRAECVVYTFNTIAWNQNQIVPEPNPDPKQRNQTERNETNRGIHKKSTWIRFKGFIWIRILCQIHLKQENFFPLNRKPKQTERRSNIFNNNCIVYLFFFYFFYHSPSLSLFWFFLFLPVVFSLLFFNSNNIHCLRICMYSICSMLHCSECVKHVPKDDIGDKECHTAKRTQIFRAKNESMKWYQTKEKIIRIYRRQKSKNCMRWNVKIEWASVGFFLLPFR